MRQLRLFHSAVSVLKVIWVILIMLGVLVIALLLFFDMEHRWSQAIITGSLTSMIMAILMLIILLDNPFGKDLHIDKEISSAGLQQIIQMSYHKAIMSFTWN